MKTPAQWMDEFTSNRWVPTPIVDERIIAMIQFDAIGHGCGRYTEATLRNAGWYFFYPTDTARYGAEFVHIHELELKPKSQLRINSRDAGTYIGPVDPPKL